MWLGGGNLNRRRKEKNRHRENLWLVNCACFGGAASTMQQPETSEPLLYRHGGEELATLGRRSL